MNPFLYQKVFTGVMAALSLVVWIGLRPVSSAFGDTVNYALGYATLDPGHIPMDWSNEWIWQGLMNGSKALGLSINAFFTIIAAGYVLSALWAIYRFMPNDPLIGVLFLLNSLMFFPFGVNGLRNGLA